MAYTLLEYLLSSSLTNQTLGIISAESCAVEKVMEMLAESILIKYLTNAINHDKAELVSGFVVGIVRRQISNKGEKQ